MPNLLITGGSGLLGLNWAVAMRERFSVVLGLHQRSISLAGVQSKLIDLTSVEKLASQLESARIASVVHAAGLTSVEQCELNPERAWYLNVDIAENVARACAKVDIPLVHISSDHLFSGKESMSTEEASPSPVNVYGKTKAEAETHVLSAHPKTLVIRTNFYGWGTGYRRSFSDRIIDALRQHHSITLFEDVYYTPILVQELVQAVHELVDQRVTGVFNVVGNECLSKYEFGIRVADIFDLDTRLIRRGTLCTVPELVRRPHNMSLLNRKVSTALGKEILPISSQLTILQRQELQGIAKELRSL